MAASLVPRRLQRGCFAFRLIRALVALALCWPATLAAQEPLVGPVHVRDGDTIVVGRVPVRLSGLHCPERGQAGGDLATEAMQSLVAAAPVSCDLTGARSHDRRVGVCHAGGVDLAETLIRRGACARCPRHDPEGRYVSAQSAAGRWPAALPRYC